MAGGDIKILDKLSINQNIIGAVISYIGVVYIAQLDVHNVYLYCLVWFVGCLSTILFFLCILSVMSSMVVYAIEYWEKKWIKYKTHKLHFEYRKKMVHEHLDSNNADATIDDLIKIKDIFK